MSVTMVRSKSILLTSNQTVMLPNDCRNINQNILKIYFFQLTWADIGAAKVVTGLKEKLGDEALKAFPKLSALRDHVYGLPNIKHWVETRPKTDM